MEGLLLDHLLDNCVNLIPVSLCVYLLYLYDYAYVGHFYIFFMYNLYYKEQVKLKRILTQNGFTVPLMLDPLTAGGGGNMYRAIKIMRLGDVSA